MNRQQAPTFELIDHINIIRAKKNELDNKTPVYTINAGTEDIVKIEFLYEAGIWYQNKSLVASCTNSMLEEGTRKYTSMQIAEKIDFYGAHIELQIGYKYATLSLYCINKYFKQTIEIVSDILHKPIFPEKELSILLKNKKHNYIINEEVAEKVAGYKFSEALYGKEHPYGKYAKLPDYDKLKVTELKKFFENYYTTDNCKIIISGKINNDHITSINKFFGNRTTHKKKFLQKNNTSINPNKDKRIFIERPDAVQSAIRVGKVLFNKLNPDFSRMTIVNIILGGYFGSRLMKNIREEKGYTYGIGSALVSLEESGYFTIASEVKKEVYLKVIDEIYIEINKLKRDLVSSEELSRVKNYIMGQMLKGFDGPFALASVLKNLLVYNLEYEYYDNYIKTIKNITAEEIRELTNKYLNINDFYEIIVG